MRGNPPGVGNRKGVGNPAWAKTIEEAEANSAKDQVQYTWKMQRFQRELVRIAAKRRGLSLLAYSRRAVIAWACRDLGLDFYDVMKDEGVRPTVVKLQPGMRMVADYPGGHGYGEWIIKETSE